MIVYVGAGSGPFRDLVIAAGHGQMVSPQVGAFRIPKKGRWAFDNGAFTDWKRGRRWDGDLFLDRVARISRLPDERLPDWFVTPDIVADRTSLSFSLRWRRALAGADRRFRWYLAVQDFMTPEDVETAMCLEPFDGLFIGGSRPWKWDTAAFWTAWGHGKGVPVHVARVNGPGPLQAAVDIDADSVDGTGWIRAGAKWLPYLQEIPPRSRLLFEPGEAVLPSEWVRFGAYLESIWSERDWGGWSQAGCPVDPRQVEGMSPEEFLEWLYRERVAPVLDRDPRDPRGRFAALYLDEVAAGPIPGERTEGWKRFVLWEVERILSGGAPEPPPSQAPAPAPSRGK